jgi:hypothetical protein
MVSVTDSSLNAISGATVYLDDLKKETTDSYGRLIIAGVLTGWHVITVKKTGYMDAMQRTNVQGDAMILIRLTRQVSHGTSESE